MKITLEQLRKLGACSDQINLFKEIFGDSVELTKDVLTEYGSKFDINWIAEKVLKGRKSAQYEAVKGLAWEQYRAVEGPAWEQYLAVKVPALEQYRAVGGQALAQYKAFCAMAFYEVVK